MNAEDKLPILRASIREKGRLLVSYSGGVDSSLLAKVAGDVLGEDALAVIIESQTLPRRELEAAVALAEHLGLNYRIARSPILEHEPFRKNPARRCYICKKNAIVLLKSIAAGEGISCISDGLNLDDCRERRPGIAACEEEGVWHPLMQAGMTKEDIRAAARKLDLQVWNKPSSACLATRVPYGLPITEEVLGMVEAAEDYLKGLGFGQMRVRAEGRTARIELVGGEMVRAAERGAEISRRLKEMGFDYVSLDLQGYRSGSMDEILWMSRD